MFSVMPPICCCLRQATGLAVANGSSGAWPVATTHSQLNFDAGLQIQIAILVLSLFSLAKSQTSQADIFRRAFGAAERTEPHSFEGFPLP